MVNRKTARIKPKLGEKLARQAGIFLSAAPTKLKKFFPSAKAKLDEAPSGLWFGLAHHLFEPEPQSRRLELAERRSRFSAKGDKLDSTPKPKIEAPSTITVSLIPSKYKVMARKVFAGLVIIFLLAALIFIRPVYPYLSQIKKVKALVVLSGSMLPTIKVGSVVIVTPPKNTPKGQALYRPGEIMTYTTGYETFTHRVVYSKDNAGTFFYKTKGDNNKDEDIGEIPEYKTIGKVILYIPVLGYLVNFAKSQKGFIFLVVVPATIIVYSEVLNIKNELVKLIITKKAQSEAKA